MRPTGDGYKALISGPSQVQGLHHEQRAALRPVPASGSLWSCQPESKEEDPCLGDRDVLQFPSQGGTCGRSKSKERLWARLRRHYTQLLTCPSEKLSDLCRPQSLYLKNGDIYTRSIYLPGVLRVRWLYLKTLGK